jgi:hypothetical protein
MLGSTSDYLRGSLSSECCHTDTYTHMSNYQHYSNWTSSHQTCQYQFNRPLLTCVIPLHIPQTQHTVLFRFTDTKHNQQSVGIYTTWYIYNLGKIQPAHWNLCISKLPPAIYPSPRETIPHDENNLCIYEITRSISTSLRLQHGSLHSYYSTTVGLHTHCARYTPIAQP